MDGKLQLFLSICSLVFLVATLSYIRRKGLDLYRSIMWFLGAAILLLMALFPKTVGIAAAMAGVETPSNFVFFIMIAFLLFTSLSMSASLSRQHARIKHLVQSIAILENRIEKLEQRAAEPGGEAGLKTDGQNDLQDRIIY